MPTSLDAVRKELWAKIDATPAEGYFYIDGIRANAAYETFYHTMEENTQAAESRIRDADISKEICVWLQETDGTFDLASFPNLLYDISIFSRDCGKAR